MFLDDLLGKVSIENKEFMGSEMTKKGGSRK
jgi:hypothetical protein